MTTHPFHKFHIPVMGLAYSIDTPVKVAHFGINSVISIIEDNLVELMRKYHYQKNNETYRPISTSEEDYRARRITDYLNLVNRLVKDQTEKLRASAFEVGSDIAKYFEMLPEDSVLKRTYRLMVSTDNPVEKENLQNFLRGKIKSGSIEVNIMTKVDRAQFNKKGEKIPDGSDAFTALRGYAKSDLTNSSVIFSAGMNPGLYNYLSGFSEFAARAWGEFNKKVTIKVSDYRSALIQGKFLAKKGIWVSEFRIESGLNCGGHAFATDGFLAGPILEEFKNKREELAESLFALYKPAAEAAGHPVFERPHPIKLTAQGGVGTFAESDFLHNYYGIDSAGWGTPFLLCPEATTVDDETMSLLSGAGESDVYLSRNSPLGVRFYNLRNTTAEKERKERIRREKPGSPCPEKFLEFNTEFTDMPICTASRKYQRRKISQLQSLDLPKDEYERQAGEVMDKECLCVGLSNAAAVKHQAPFLKGLRAVTICPGPNIAYFSKVASLKEMTDHIYGRSNLIQRNDRPHMFIKELQLYIDFIKEKIDNALEHDAKFVKYCASFCQNLFNGIDYYRQLFSADRLSASVDHTFEEALKVAAKKLERLMAQNEAALQVAD